MEHLANQNEIRGGKLLSALISKAWTILPQKEARLDLKRLHCATSGSGKVSLEDLRTASPYLCGRMVISRSAAILSAKGGCVLKSEENVPPPNRGLTIHSDDVDGEMAVVGMRLL